MKNRELLLLLLSIFGIFSLLLISNLIKPEKVFITEITTERINQQVELIVNITRVTNFQDKNFQILNLEDETGTITATSNSKEKIEINKSQLYQIMGRITLYNQTLQININEIIEIV